MTDQDFFEQVNGKIDELGVAFQLGTRAVVQRWLLSEDLPFEYGPFNAEQGSAVEGRPWLPVAARLGRGDLQWAPFEYDGSFFARLGAPPAQPGILYVAFAVDSNEPSPTVIRFYNKGNLKIWVNSELVFIGQREVKYLDELVTVSMRAGRNYVVIEKERTSILLRVARLQDETSSMREYLSPELIQAYTSGLSVVPEGLFLSKNVASCVILPRAPFALPDGECRLIAYSRGHEVARVEGRLWQPLCLELPVDVRGRVELRAQCSKAAGDVAIYVGDVEQSITHSRALVAEHAPKRMLADLNAWLDELLDIRRSKDVPLYEKRSSLWEEIGMLFEGLERFDSLAERGVSSAEDFQAFERGLQVHSFASRLDDTPQKYWVFVPQSYDPKRPAAVVVLLKYLFKKVQVPGALFKGGLRSVLDSANVLFVCPMGRGVNRYEVAGELDCLEALEDASRRYSVNRARVFVAGFSMGGGAAWNLAQKYPDTFRGVVAWSSATNPSFDVNLVNTSVTYLSGKLDPLFAYDDNVKRLAGEPWSNPELFDARRVEGATHFSFHSVYDDVMLARWAETKPIEPEPERLSFRSADLRYRACRFVEISALENPSSAGAIRAECAGSTLRVSSDNVVALRLKRADLDKRGIGQVIWNQRAFELPAQKEEWCEFDTSNDQRRTLSGLGNRCGSGLYEVFYERTEVIWASPAVDNGLAKRLAQAYVYPKYYADFRERYAELALADAGRADLARARERNLVLIGDRSQNPILHALCRESGAGALLEEVLSLVAGPRGVAFVKVPGFSASKRALLIVVEGAVSEAVGALPIFRAKFSPPFNDDPDLMRHDAVVFAGDRAHVFNFDRDWRIATSSVTTVTS